MKIKVLKQKELQYSTLVDVAILTENNSHMKYKGEQLEATMILRGLNIKTTRENKKYVMSFENTFTANGDEVKYQTAPIGQRLQEMIINAVEGNNPDTQQAPSTAGINFDAQADINPVEEAKANNQQSDIDFGAIKF